MSEGYGKDFTFWDNLVGDKFKDELKTLGPHKYRNFEVFKSPAGRWMAFHNNSYTDIKIYDLETLKPVIENFYSLDIRDSEGKYDREKSVYNGFHTNVSSFVPTYVKRNFVNKRITHTYFTEVCEIDESYVNNADDIWKDFVSLPIAFNAFTLWGADYELYVDVLDLSKIDEGTIKKYPAKPSFIIPHGADRVGAYVKCDVDFTIDMKPKEGEEGVYVSTGTTSDERGEYYVNFSVLEERTRDTFSFNTNTGVSEFYENTKEPYKPEDELPWQSTKKKLDEYKANKVKNNG